MVSHDDDVYLWCRESKHLKVSLHQSGSCHEAFACAFVQGHAPADSSLRKQRKVEQWQRDVDPKRALLAYRVVLHGGGVTTPQSSPRDDRVVWLAEPPTGKHVVVGVVFAPPDWAGQGDPLAHYDLSDGSRLFLRHWVSTWVFPAQQSGQAQYFGNHGKHDLAKDGLRMSLAGTDGWGRFFVDAAVKWRGPVPEA